VAVGALFSVYNLFLSLFVIRKICIICTLLQGINISLFIYLAQERRRLYQDIFAIKFTQYFYSQLLISCLLLFTGFQIQKNVNSDISDYENNKKDDAYLTSFFSSSKVDFNFTDQVSILGNETAPIEIVIISDFECTYCRDAASVLGELYSSNQNDIKLAFIHFPLDKTVNPYTPNSNHIYAGVASKASICLSQKESFWKFHDEFFENQKNFSPDFFNDFLETYNLRDCIDKPETINTLNYHMDLAKMAGIKGTPTVFINGRRMNRWYNKELLAKIIRIEKSRSEQDNPDIGLYNVHVSDDPSTMIAYGPESDIQESKNVENNE
jgi:hypothetical protein